MYEDPLYEESENLLKSKAPWVTHAELVKRHWNGTVQDKGNLPTVTQLRNLKRSLQEVRLYIYSSCVYCFFVLFVMC